MSIDSPRRLQQGQQRCQLPKASPEGEIDTSLHARSGHKGPIRVRSIGQTLLDPPDGRAAILWGQRGG